MNIHPLVKKNEDLAQYPLSINLENPSSLTIVLKAWINPVYFSYYYVISLTAITSKGLETAAAINVDTVNEVSF